MAAKEEKQLEILYNLAIQQQAAYLERKRHIEIKCLYLLQAITILITLFLGIAQPIYRMQDTLPFAACAAMTILKIGFYAFVGVALIVLIASLNDRIGRWFNNGASEFISLELSSVKDNIVDNEYPTHEDLYEDLIDAPTNSISSVEKIMIFKGK